jgi:undecaprenyl-diphosphatase
VVVISGPPPAIADRIRSAENRDYLFKLAASFGVTAVLGLWLKALGVELPETLGPVAGP